MNEPIFIPAPFFFLRSPRWTWEKAVAILSEEKWIDAVFELYKTDTLLQEAIAIASPSLFQELEKGTRSEEVAATLFKYSLRMATRATPFGFFSFIADGSWRDKTDVSFDLKKVSKRVRPNMSWVFALLEKIYADKEQFSLLSVQTNRLVKMTHERCFLSYLRYAEKDDERSAKISSIRATKLVKTILALAEMPKKVGDLYEELLQVFPTLDREKTERVIQQLVEQQFLLPGILPSVLSLSPFDDLLPHLSSVDSIEKMRRGIEGYEEIPLGKGTSALRALEKECREIVSTGSVLQIDTVYPESSARLSPRIGKELSEVTTLLWKLSPRRPMNSPVQMYHSKFMEKYGMHRTVPLMELLSEEKGLGPMLQEAGPNQQTAFKTHWEKWLHTQWESCLHDQKNEIVLTEDLVSRLYALAKEDPTDPHDALLSMDLFCTISAKSAEEIDEGNFLLHLVQPSWQGGSAIGRFLYLLDKKRQDQLKQFFSEEEALEKESVFMEISYWPRTGHNANVVAHPPLRKHHLDLQSKQKKEGSFSLNDIYVGTTGTRFYLTLKEGGCELVSRVCNFLNPIIAPQPLQFMREVSLTKYQLFHPFSWGALEKKGSFLPRVRFQKTIVSPSQWNVDPSLFDLGSLEKIIQQFTAWADQWNLPDRCLLTHLDQHLLVDRHHPASLREIALKLKKMESLQFLEEIPHAWANSSEGHHSCEFVIPVLKNPIYAKKSSIVPLAHIPVELEDRLRLPGSEWLFMKIYLEEEAVDRFLVEHILSLAQELEGLFFVRYYDTGFHLRVRIRVTDFALLMEKIEGRINYWMQTGLIQNIVWAPYEREIERYGGIQLIHDAELLFCKDSSSVLSLLESVLNKNITFVGPVLHALSGIGFLKSLGLELQEVMEVLKSGVKSTDGLKGFREHKKELIRLVKEFPFTGIDNSDFQKIAKSVLHQSIYDLYNSLLHMHYNRLGCSRSEEDRARLYGLHTIMSLQYARNTKTACIET